MCSDDPLVLQRSSLNAYRLALALLFNQIKWDIRPTAWRSRSRLRAMRDRWYGQKAVILCNGPSLLNSDLSLLDGVFTFGLNKINLLFDDCDFRPSCIVSVNPHVIEQNAAFFSTTPIPLFLSRCAVSLVKPRKGVTYLNSVNYRQFAKDCSMGVYEGHTVTFVAMQLAFHMGFRRVALIGCDHHFSTSGPANKLVGAREQDPDHFSPRYFSGSDHWQLPDLGESEVSYKMARAMFEAHGRSIVNATDGGRLEVFERSTLQSFIAA